MLYEVITPSEKGLPKKITLCESGSGARQKSNKNKQSSHRIFPREKGSVGEISKL